MATDSEFQHANLYVVEVKVGPFDEWGPMCDMAGELVTCPLLIGAKWKASLASKRFHAVRIVRYSQPEVVK